MTQVITQGQSSYVLSRDTSSDKSVSFSVPQHAFAKETKLFFNECYLSTKQSARPSEKEKPDISSPSDLQYNGEVRWKQTLV